MLLLLIPPVVKPCEPLLGPYSLARVARMQGIACIVLDCNLEWLCDRLWGQTEPPTGHQGGYFRERLLSPPLSQLQPRGAALEPVGESRRPARTCMAGAARPAFGVDDGPGEAAIRSKSARTQLQRARRHVARGNALARLETYENLDRYGQAIEHLEAVLRHAHRNGTDERAGLANFEVVGLRPVSRQDLLAYAGREETVFDEYIEKRVFPVIRERRPDTIGISFTFLQQGFAVIRFAKRIRERCPDIRLILGGPMAACWRKADWVRPPLDLFDAVFSAWPNQPPASAGRVFSFRPPEQEGFYPDLQDLPKSPFFAPQPILPMAFDLGCSWGGCRFCPEYQSRSPLAGERDGWLAFLEAWLTVHGATVLHLTDSCVDPSCLDRLADAIAERQWPVRWYGFVRLTAALLAPGRLARWARGGCGLLEFGLETAAEELLQRMNKGISVGQAAEILHRSAGLGIHNFVYLLFGFPAETSAHQHETLDFVIRHRDAIHYLNNSILNLPRHSPIARSPHRFGIHALAPFPGEDSDLSLYTDFSDHLGSARQRARRFLQQNFLREEAVRTRTNAVPPVFKSNHAIFFDPKKTADDVARRRKP